MLALPSTLLNGLSYCVSITKLIEAVGEITRPPRSFDRHML